MLVLDLPESDIIQLGPDIRILVRRVHGGRVSLAIDAPRHIQNQRIPMTQEAPLESQSDMPQVVLRRRRAAS
jgi:sRNA-binding carbon storage regulator CsrA